MQARVSTFAQRPISQRRVRSVTVRAAGTVLDGAALRAVKEAAVREAVDKYAKESVTWTQVKFTLRRRSGLGDSWKVVGPAAELGRWVPDVAPRMVWSEGDTWTTAVRLPPGEHEFKAALRAADGTTTWEDGPDRSVVVPPGGGQIEVQLDVRMPGEEAPLRSATPATAAPAAPEPAAAAASPAPPAAPVSAPSPTVVRANGGTITVEEVVYVSS